MPHKLPIISMVSNKQGKIKNDAPRTPCAQGAKTYVVDDVVGEQKSELKARAFEMERDIVQKSYMTVSM